MALNRPFMLLINFFAGNLDVFGIRMYLGLIQQFALRVGLFDGYIRVSSENQFFVEATILIKLPKLFDIGATLAVNGQYMWPVMSSESLLPLHIADFRYTPSLLSELIHSDILVY